MRLKYLFLLTVTAIVITACKNESKTSESEDTMTTEGTELEMPEAQESKVRLTPLTNSPAYTDAILKLDTPETMIIPKAGDFAFTFEMENYELGAQTDSPNASLLANSGKGQHIHFILNNQPYSAHYEPNFSKALPDGVHHLVAFLSRSYHESVKNDNSMVVRKLVVGTKPTDTIGIDLNTPTLIYSRPKGTYAGNGAENVLLDFFVLNTDLSEEGNKVRATINGEEFIITEWVPHVMTGLEMGEVRIKLELIDASGNAIPGPFNTVERSITLTE